MGNTMKISKSTKSIRPIIAACYPEWKGRKLSVEASTSYQMSNYWDGGSRNYVVAYDLTTGKVAESMPLAGNPFRDQAHARVEIPEGVLLVEHSIFCGRDAGVTIYANPANMPRLLPEPTP